MGGGGRLGHAAPLGEPARRIDAPPNTPRWEDDVGRAWIHSARAPTPKRDVPVTKSVIIASQRLPEA